MSANDRQVGGNHYQTASGVQHWDIMAAMFGAVWFVACATKYASRHRLKKGLEDLMKAGHYLEKLAELCTTQAGLFSLFPAEAAARAICDSFLAGNPQIPQEDHGMLRAIFMVRDEVTLVDAQAAIAACIAAEYSEEAIAEAKAAATAHKSVDVMLEMAEVLGGEVGDFLMTTSAWYNGEGQGIQDALNQKLAAAQAFPDGSEAATAAQQAAIQEATSAEAGLNEGFRWLQIARTDLQKGFMALRRAIARPKGF